MKNQKLLSAGKARRAEKKESKGKRVVPEHRTMVSEAAYYNAEKRGFVPGLEDQDWYRAEEQLRQEYGW